MTKLKMIQKFAQQVATAMAAVLDLEVAMIDERLCLVAATRAHNQVGETYQKNTISYQVLCTGKTFVVPNSRYHEACQLCPHRPSCIDVAEICLPIVVQDKVIGVFAILALDEQQKDRLLNKERKLVEFVAKVTDLIGYAINARELTDRLSLLANEMQAIANSVTDGIIAVESSGLIRQANKPAQQMLHLSAERLVGRSVTDIFRDPVIKDAIKSDSTINNQGIYAVVGGKKLSFLGNLTPISTEKRWEGKGHVLVIRNISEVTKMFGNYFLNGGNFTFENIIGTSKVIKVAKEKALTVAKGDSTIIILGESGTGKELFARSIHSASFRGEGPFVAVNCAALPDTLLESELFGYEDGAFSGAKKGGKSGRFEMANKGTLFLDEIGDMPLHLQVKLLRVLEEKMIYRLGGTNPIPVDVRIIAATHKHLEKQVQVGEFREDLYYRLQVIPLTIPPLRDRQEDLQMMMDYFRSKFNELLGKNTMGYSPKVKKLLLDYHWPGNVRELENTLEYAVNMEKTDYIQLSSIPDRILNAEQEEKKLLGTIPEMEKDLIEHALQRYGTTTVGKEKAAKVLDIGIATLYRKMKKYSINGKVEREIYQYDN